MQARTKRGGVMFAYPCLCDCGCEQGYDTPARTCADCNNNEHQNNNKDD